jgi:hypothetical protein
MTYPPVNGLQLYYERTQALITPAATHIGFRVIR